MLVKMLGFRLSELCGWLEWDWSMRASKDENGDDRRCGPTKC